MKELAGGRARGWLVVVFAIAMAWVEAACVYYLRTLVNRLDPYQANPLPMQGALEPIELVREAATLVMLGTIGALAGRTWRTRLGYTCVAFGVWDIFYYVFLRVMCGWPRSLFDWDVLFLLPVPWWGPVLAPVSVALLMIAWGTLVQHVDEGPAASFTSTVGRLNGLGIVLALYTFTSDSLRVLPEGIDATRMVLPQTFNWPLFLIAFGLMAAPIAHMLWRRRTTVGRCATVPGHG